jgi:phosphoserine aminotransferase
MAITNFYSGPSILPQVVLKKAQEALVNFENTGLSILEISHRSDAFVAVMENARSIAKELMGLGDDYEAIYMQGGASSQFYMVPQNFLSQNQTAAFIDTGTWAHGAMEQASLFGNAHTVASSKKENYNHIPKTLNLPSDAVYLHLTSNNTIFGTQYHFLNGAKKHFGVSYPIVADMSSDILSREMNYSDFDLIYAGAQKNIGTSGATLVVIKKDFLEKNKAGLPAMVDYKVQVAQKSMKNTPPVFSVYISYLTLLWIKAQGKENIFSQNEKKANLLYDTIDRSNLYQGNVANEDRSMMNVCFTLREKALEKTFAEFAKQNEIVGIEGHRSVGGFRASIYNAMPISGVEKLIEVMRHFEKETA